MRITLVTWLVSLFVGSIAGFFLLGLTTHSGGIFFVLGNMLMPGVILAGLTDVAPEKSMFWFKVAIVQAVYYALVVWVFLRVKMRTVERTESKDEAGDKADDKAR